MSTDLHAVGQLVREHLPVATSDSQHLKARARLLEASSNRQHALSAWRWPVLSLATTAAALLLWLSQSQPAQLTATADGQVVSLGLGSNVEAQRALVFSDGSSVALRTPGALRLTGTTERGADLELMSGRALVSVTPKPQAHWRVSAGPYVVHVVGTRFELGWDEEVGRLTLAMEEGKVRVVGPRLGEGKWLGHGEQFEATVSGWKDEGHGSGEALVDSPPLPTSERPAAVPDSKATDEPQPRLAAPTPAQSAAPPAQASAASERPATRAPAPRAPRVRPKPHAWTLSERVGLGQYAEAVAEAEAVGIPRVLDSAPVHELMALADAARFSERPALARQALGSVRSRFSDSASSAAAAFMLGRLAQNADPVLALDWYDTYLREAPSGALVQEAMGRRLMLLSRLGTPSARLKAAEEYLSRYPEGPHAHYARSLAGSTSTDD